MEEPGTADGALCRGFAWFYWLFGRRGTYYWMSFDVAFGANRYMEFREVPDLVRVCARRGHRVVAWQTAVNTPTSLRVPQLRTQMCRRSSLTAGLMRGRRGLARGVVAPAGEGAVGLHPTRKLIACADGGESACRRSGLAIGVVAPTGNRAVGPHSHGVFVTRRDGNNTIQGHNAHWRNSLHLDGKNFINVRPVAQLAIAVASPGPNG